MSIALDNRQLSTDWYVGTRRRRLALMTALVFVASLALARMVLSFNVGVVAGVGAWIALVAITVRPRYGVYLLFGIVLFFEIGNGSDPFMAPGFYLNASPQASLNLAGAVLTPMEMLLLLTTLTWIAGAAVRQRFDYEGGAFGLPVTLFFVALVFGILRGLLGGAIFNFIFWESRFLVAMILCYVLAANTIRTRAHIRTLLTLILLGVGASGVEGVWRKFALGDSAAATAAAAAATAATGITDQVAELVYSHDDVVLWGLLIMLVLAQQVFGAPRWQRLLGPPALLVTAFAMLVSERRAGWVAIIVAFVALAAVLFFAKRKAFWLLVLPLVIVTAVYMPVFWNNTGVLGQPARAVRSIRDPDPRDASSNAWRDLEAINVRATIESDPLLGVGFGQPFLQVVTVPSIATFEFWNYEAHHDIHWVWLKTGALGFIAFFMLMLSGIARSVWIVRTFKDWEYRIFGVLTMSAVILSVVFCYVDLGLTSSRVPMMLGIMLGVTGVIHRIHNRELAEQASSSTRRIRT